MAGMAAVGVAAAASMWGALRPDTQPVAAAAVASRLAERQPQVPGAASASTVGQQAAAAPSSAPAQAMAGHSETRTAKPGTPAAGQLKAANAAAPRRASGATGAPGQAVAQAGGRRDAGQEHAIGGLVPPSETCKDKLFLAKQFCVYTECQKPGFQNFPSCVRLRDDARLRDGSRTGN